MRSIRPPSFACLFAFSLGVTNVPSALLAQQDAATGTAQEDWKFDRILLDNEKVIEGLILTGDDRSDLEFVEVRRLPGKPMNLVIRNIDRRKIVRVDRLDEEDQTQLRGRLEKFIHRAAIEARQMDGIQLSSNVRDGVTYWQYQGNGFWLESTANEETTKRAAVRIEQIFTAYRQILPPRRTPQRRLKIMLFGDDAQYATFLRGLGLEITNPAFFAADFNIVAAGSNVNRFMEELESTRSAHKNAKEQMEADWRQLPTRLAEYGEQLRKNGISDAERKAVIAAEQRTWQERRQKLQDDIARADRRNAAKFDQVTGEMFARLYHEAFHAYLDNYVYPHHEFDVPRWLNEGLALTFEGGQLEAGTLRIDAPNRRVLAALQADLRGPNPLPLKDLLSADADAFLPAHRGSVGKAARLYEYSWGLAYYLAFETMLLDSDTFAEFITPAATATPAVNPVSRFEKLVGKPLDEFELEWRAAMLNPLAASSAPAKGGGD
jgi:hypothetical protein